MQFVSYHEVLNNNNEVICDGQVTNDSGKTVHYGANNNPFGPGLEYICGERGTVSTSWHDTVSASGQATTKITCPSDR